MNISFDKFLMYDIFEQLSKYLSVQDIINIFSSNKMCYNIYKRNENYCNRIFVKKIIRFFAFERIFGKTDSVKHLFRMFYYFKNHRICYRADFLIYMIDNSIKDIELFYFYASQCRFRNIIKNNLYNDTDADNEDNDDTDEDNRDTDEDNTGNVQPDRRIIYYSDLYISDWYVPNRFNNNTIKFISLNDMKYILLNSDIDQLNILFDLFNIPISLLSYTIKEMLFRNYSPSDNYLMTFVKYMFVKHCFGKFNDIDNSYIFPILSTLISYKRTNILKYFLNKKRQYMVTGQGIDYQSLVNKCIELQDKVHLDILMNENKYDNSKNLLQKHFIIINTHRIINLCRSAKFNYLKYLVENYLGKNINSMIYIESICVGLEKLILSKNFKLIANIQLLSEYINDSNKIYINDYISRCYDNVKLNKSKRFLMY